MTSVLLAACTAATAAPVVVNVVGSGPLGFDNGLNAGNGGLASQASLNAPTGVAVDADGDYVIADFLSDRIRQAGRDGRITAIAGDGWPGNLGGGLGVNTSLWGPYDVAVRGTGLVFSDAYNASVRSLSAAGAISTLAGLISTQPNGGRNYSSGWSGFAGDGGPAASARLNWPLGVCTDGAGRVYVADSYNQRVRMIDGANNISTVAGNGWTDRMGRGRFAGDGGQATQASLNWPTAVAVDVSGNLYIADCYNQRIRRVDGVTKVITTVAGNGMVGNSGDDGDALLATLNHPQGLAFGQDGTLYIADSLNHRVRALKDGVITAVAGSGQRGWSGDNGAALEATFNEPRGLAVTPAGDLLVADTGNNRVRMVIFGPTSTVHGTVRDARSGEAVPGAVVASSGLSTVADANGAYTLAARVGVQPITATAPTYGPATDNVEVVADAVAEHDFLLPSGTVTGHVVDDGGHIVSGATITAPEGTAYSDISGAFSLRLAPGQQALTASMASYGATTTTVNVPVNATIAVKLVVNRLRSTVAALTYDHDWISPHENAGDYNTPSGDYAFAAEQLPPSSSIFTFPVGTATVDFLFPNKADGANNVIGVNGQTIAVPAGRYSGLHLLEASQYGAFTAPLTLNYQDGSSSVSLVWSDWAALAIGQTPGANESVAVQTDHRHQAGAAQSSPPVTIFHSGIPVNSARTLVSFTLPADPAGSGTQDGWVFAASLDAVGTSVRYGDVDADGSVSVADAAHALQAAAGLTTLPLEAVIRADLAPAYADGSFGDGRVDVSDVAAVLKLAAG